MSPEVLRPSTPASEHEQFQSGTEIEFTSAEEIQTSAIRAKGDIVIFPEGVIGRWTEATQIFWEPTISQLTAQGMTALIGAGIPIPGSTEYRNAMLIIGAEHEGAVSATCPSPARDVETFGPKDGVPLRVSRCRVPSPLGPNVSLY